MQFEMTIPKPFNFEATIKTHGWFQLPPFYWDPARQMLNWVTRVGEAIFLLHLKTEHETGSASVVRFSGDFAEWARPQIEQKFRHFMNLDIDLTDYYAVCQTDPILRHVPERGIGRLMRAESVWEDVFKSICGTNVQWKQAVKMIHTVAQLGEVAPGTDMHLFPGPQHILAAGETFLRETGRVGYRSGYLLDLADRFARGEPKAAQVERGELTAEELRKYFLSFKGVGKSTAQYLTALYGHFEFMSIDSLVIKYMKEQHFNGAVPTEAQINQFYEKFGKWRYLAYWMEFIINEGWNPDN